MSNDVQKIRIGYMFNHPFFLGGGEISLFELIRSIDKNRFEPIVIVPDDGEIKRKFDQKKIKVFINSLPSMKHIICSRPVLSLFTLSKILNTNYVDIVHTNGSRACFYGGLAGRMLGIPAVWHVRESIQDYYFYDGLLGLLAQVIICVSRSVHVKRFRGFGNLINKKIFEVYNGVDTLKYRKSKKVRKNVRDRFGVKENDIFFGIIGNIIPRKGQDFFLKALVNALEKKKNLAVKALIIGRPLDPDFNNGLNQFTLNNGLKKHVIFGNYSEDIVEIFSALDVFVLPSKSEGFSRALIEAMSLSLPVLATNISEVGEAVIDGENAILVDFNDITSMASAIIELSENDELRKNIGKKNRRRAVDYFDLKTHARSIEEIYMSLISDRL